MQPEQPKLRVKAVSGRLINDELALKGGARFRYIGRTPTKQPPSPAIVHPIEAVFPPEEREYPDNADHRYLLKALRKGDIVACDWHTARRAGVPLPKGSE